MSKVNVSLTRAQAVEQRQKLLRWLTKERIESIVEHVEGANVRGSIRYDFQYALSATRTCDCVIRITHLQIIELLIFIKAKPISQTFLDSVKQLNQERLLYSKYNPHYRNGIKRVIITYDRDKTDDQLLRDQEVWVIRAFDFPLRPYQPIDGV